MPFGLVVKNASNIRSACSGAIPVPESWTLTRTILEMLGTHTEHVRPICDRSHRVDCIREEVQKHLLKLHSIGLHGGQIVEKL